MKRHYAHTDTQIDRAYTERRITLAVVSPTRGCCAPYSVLWKLKGVKRPTPHTLTHTRGIRSEICRPGFSNGFCCHVLPPAQVTALRAQLSVSAAAQKVSDETEFRVVPVDIRPRDEKNKTRSIEESNTHAHQLAVCVCVFVARRTEIITGGNHCRSLVTRGGENNDVGYLHKRRRR